MFCLLLVFRGLAWLSPSVHCMQVLEFQKLFYGIVPVAISEIHCMLYFK